ncbi:MULTISPECIES: ABC transporter substrate-binding protein [unclassified Kitasatospora]|uniref:ABC transporter substrate-binding protein n=1 Tax=unclassified Kitasatospora TaxID=2633591 RepID=UPI003681C57F
MLGTRFTKTLLGAAVVGALSLGLTACGSSGSGGSAGDSGSSSTAAAKGGKRSIDTAFGAVEVPAEAKRVVALGDTSLDTALALGVTPVGTSSSRGGTTAPAYLKADGIPLVATVKEPNLEAILKATPDLILASSGIEKSQYDKLSAVAPTIVPKAGDWREVLAVYGDALGHKADLAAKLDALDKRAAKAGEGKSGSAVVMRWMPNGPIVMNTTNMPGDLLKKAGAGTMPIADGLGAQPHSDPLSLENLNKADADRVFVATLNAEGEKALETARKQEAFTRLKAVGTNQLMGVDGQVWSSSSGPIAAEKVVEDIEKAFGAK